MNQNGSVYLLYNGSSKNTIIYTILYAYQRVQQTSFTFINAGNCSNNRFLNNIFANLNGGYAYYASSTSGIDSSNYNCLFSTGINLAYWNGARTNLSALKAANGKEAFSISENPLFIDSTYNLHITNKLLKKGIYIDGFYEDIDGQIRNNQPTMGADEIYDEKFLKLKLYLEGYYNGDSLNAVNDENGFHWQNGVCDKININLLSKQLPYLSVKAFTEKELMINGECYFKFEPSFTDSLFYISIKHQNRIETWSSLPV